MTAEHAHCDMDPIECTAEALAGEYEERGRRIAELEAQLAARSHEAIDARNRAELAEGILRKLIGRHVIEKPTPVGEVWVIEDGSDGYREAIVTDAEAALIDTITEEKTE
jgi:hypothetical protein